jgi:CubicO group peptidase (beta-lactamase class C family)
MKHCILSLLLFLGSTVFAQSQNAIAVYVQAQGDSVFKAAKPPGIFVALSAGGKNQYFSFGYAVPEQKIPFDSATVFEMGSITKTFTAYVVQAVLEERSIPDTTSILSYLPDSVQSNKSLKAISLRSLLNHTSGLPRLPTNMKPADPMQPYLDYTGKDLFAFLKTAKPEQAGAYDYSNLGAGLAGVLAQRISGKSFEQLLQQYIYQPFGITPTPATAVKSVGYFNGTKSAYWDMAVLAPAGGLKCTAQQLLQYLSSLSQPKNKFLATRLDQFLQPTQSINARLSIAKGWHLLQNGQKHFYWHNGGTYGFSTFAAFERNTGNAVVVVINQFNANEAADKLGVQIMRKLMSDQ